ncbi:hypothetical protein HD598_001970 [Neomicrococcus aestuarii]|uniref:Uncharacterized protein n=1 Tax=Neomicrococcus aestuarii TaxID=556325 RepID=A0A7W8TWF6_9MICC|nr:hypothetical protein [Neomicrococcus aestuarii]MBB5513283.1 hypothetical protein [Neomicrococcus aestuarii]
MPEKTISAPTRRSVAKGIAWSAPVIAAASLAPFAAASPARCPVVTPGGSGDPCGLNAKAYTQVDYTHVVDNKDPYLVITQRLQVLLPVGTTLTTGQSITLTVDIGGVTTGLTATAVLEPTVTQLDVAVTTSSINNGTGTRLQVVITANNNYTFNSALWLVLTLKIPLSSIAAVSLGGLLGNGITIQLTSATATGATGCGGAGSILSIPIPSGAADDSLTQLATFVASTLSALVNTGLKVCLPLGLGSVILNINV